MDNNPGIQTIIGTAVECSSSLPETPEFRALYHLLSAFMCTQLAYNEDAPDECGWKTRLLERVRDRMDRGRSSYGHGIRISDDTRQWGTQRDSWAEMCEEEIVDGLIYMSAEMLRKGTV